MLEPVAQQFPHMVVIQGVIHMLPAFSGLDHPCGPKNPELMGYGRLIHPQDIHQVAYAQFPDIECRQYPEAACLPEDFKKTGELQEHIIFR